MSETEKRAAVIDAIIAEQNTKVEKQVQALHLLEYRVAENEEILRCLRILREKLYGKNEVPK